MPLRHRVAVQAERSRRAGDDGFVMSSPLALMSAAAVVMAGVAFLATDRDPAAGPEQAMLAAGPIPIEKRVTLEAIEPARTAKPAVKRSDVYVSVYNNSNITGLAGSTAARITSAGWQVTGSDNWYGTIPATTIYFPARFEEAAGLLSKDLGIQRMLPAVDPMSMDRLTVILTADFG